MENPRTGPRHESDQREHHHQRDPDRVEGAEAPLEPKGKATGPLEGPGHEPGAGTPPPQDEDPHHVLNNPVGDPDPTADSDPYQPADE